MAMPVILMALGVIFIFISGMAAGVLINQFFNTLNEVNDK
jgi:hypothetical protein